MPQTFTKRTTLEKLAAALRILKMRGGELKITGVVETAPHQYAATLGELSYRTVMGRIVARFEYDAGVVSFTVVKLPFCLTDKQVWAFVEPLLN